MKDKSKLKFVSIQSKVSVGTAARVDAIVKKYDFESRYELMQYLLSTFLKFADPEGEGDEITSELLELAKIFEGFENKKNRIITVKPAGNKQLRLTDTINIFTEEGKSGYVCRKIATEGDSIHTTASNEKAMATVIKKLYPSLYDKLLNVGRSIDECSVTKIIEFLIDDSEKSIGLISDEIAKECEDNTASIEYGNVPCRMRTREMD